MHTPRGAWSLAGLVAGLAGLAASHLAAALLHVRSSPLVVVSETVVALMPAPLVEWGIEAFGVLDKAVLVAIIVLTLAAVFTWAGRLARRARWLMTPPYAVLAAIGAAAVVAQPGATATADLVPVVAGLATWLLVTTLLCEPLQRQDLEADARMRPATAGPPGEPATHATAERPTGLLEGTRRTLLLSGGVVAALAVAGTVGGEVLARGRRGIERARSLLALDVSRPTAPAAARIDVPGVTAWITPNDRFYVIHTAFAVPTIDPVDWQLRIHGMVEREVVVDFADLVSGDLVEGWTTLNCVSNEVGGDLVGNAWWSGVPSRTLLERAGPLPGADAVLQTSEDGWTCGTPLSALLDTGRGAMLAVAMNGEPLPVEHGFPVRTIVPGLYGYVSACKWVVDWEVTRFDDVEAYWTTQGWAEQGPVKIASRVDVPASGDEVDPGDVVVAGVAWMQHTGISAVEVALDGGAWTPGEIADAGQVDAWVQWRAVLPDVTPGDHRVRVRAVDTDGNVQTGIETGTVPDGATGWHEVEFGVREG